MTASTLRSYTIKDLEQLAKRRGVSSWRGMRKDDLVRAILRKVKTRTAQAKTAKKPTVAARPALRAVAAKNRVATSKPAALKSSTMKRAAQTAVALKSASMKSVAIKSIATKSTPIKSAASKISTIGNSRFKSVQVKAVQGKAVALNGAAGKHAPSSNGSSHGVDGKSAAKNGVAKHAGLPVARPARTRPATPQEIAQKAKITAKIEQERMRATRSKNLAFGQIESASGAAAKDRLVLMVRGPYWLHAYWDLTATGIARAQAALGQQWHQARPILRVLIVADNSNTSSERVLREIPIHGGVKNWYVDVQEPSLTYRMEIGYLAVDGKFFSLARSNVVTTPTGAASDSLDLHWNDVLADCDKIYAMSGGYSTEGANDLQDLFEERLRRPMGTASGNRFGANVEGLLPRDRKLRFHVDAEIVIHGQTQAEAAVTLQGEPLKLRPDGTFSVRLDLPNRRQVIPLVASTKDGVEQRTIVLAVERNTKIMEPLTRESGTE